MAFGKKPAPPKRVAPVAVAPPPVVQVQPQPAAPQPMREATDADYREASQYEHHLMMDYVGMVNASLPDGINVWPFIMVPEECWEGPWGPFLLKALVVSPFVNWNMVLLPRDEASSQYLGLPIHPRHIGSRGVAAINDYIGRIVARTKAVYEENDTRTAAGGQADPALEEEAIEAAIRDMEQLALTIGRKAIGAEALDAALYRFHTKEGMAA